MKKKNVFLMILGIVLFVIILFSSMYFNRNYQIHIESDAAARLSEIIEPNVISFDLQVNEQIKKVNTFADYLGEVGDLSGADTHKLLVAAVKNNGLVRCAIAFPNGTFITHDDKNVGDVSQDDFFIANMRGEFFITDPRTAVVDPTKKVVLFTAPIVSDKEIIGSMIYSYPWDDMDRIFNFEFLNNNGEMQVVKENGDYLLGKRQLFPEISNLVDYFTTNCTHERHNKNECLNVSKGNNIVAITLKNSVSPILVSVNHLVFNDWVMLSIVPENAPISFVSEATTDQRNYILIVIFCVVTYLVALWLVWITSHNNVDKLTGSLTLDSFKRKAKQLLKQSHEHTFVMVKLDIKNFKIINRIYDFEEGDRVIKNVALALRIVIGNMNALQARVGIDTFVILLPYTNSETLNGKRYMFIDKFRELMGSSFTTNVDFPTGQYILTKEDFPRPDIDEILEKVNFAHRAAKQKDWGMTVDYVVNIEKEAMFERAIEDKMSYALHSEEFRLYLQPKYRVSDETLYGAEALVRWEVNGSFYMHPNSFIPILEKNGFIVKIDFFMFEKAVEKIKSYIDAGLKPYPISVNFSRAHLMDDKFIEKLCSITNRYGVPRKFLEIELVESAIFSNVEKITQFIDELHKAGFTMAMDDFGSGYSSLALLKELKVDVLKLDRAFFMESQDQERSIIVISNMIKMAQELNAITVAEGVEQMEQVEYLRKLGCDVIQGFYYSKPLPASDFYDEEGSPAKINKNKT